MESMTKEDIDNLLKVWHRKMMSRDRELRREIESGLSQWNLQSYADHCEGYVDVTTELLEQASVSIAKDSDGYERQQHTPEALESAYETAGKWLSGADQEDNLDWVGVVEEGFSLDALDQLSRRELLRAFLWSVMETYRAKAEKCSVHQRPNLQPLERPPFSPISGAGAVNSLVLSEAWIEYCKDQGSKSGAWNDGKVPVSATQAYDDMQALWGDVRIDEIDRPMCREFAKLQEKRPLKKEARYTGWSVREILAADIPIETRRKGATPKEIVSRLSAFLGWAEDNHYVIRSPANRVPVAIIEGTETLPWTDAELGRLFDPMLIQQHSELGRPNTKCTSFPLVMILLLYTGARLNEICYLRSEDFKEADEHSKAPIPTITIVD
jgi:hypothetical protein